MAANHSPGRSDFLLSAGKGPFSTPRQLSESILSSLEPTSPGSASMGPRFAAAGAPGAQSGLPAEWRRFPGGPLEIQGGEGDPQHLGSQQVSLPAWLLVKVTVTRMQAETLH